MLADFFLSQQEEAEPGVETSPGNTNHSQSRTWKKDLTCGLGVRSHRSEVASPVTLLTQASEILTLTGFDPLPLWEIRCSMFRAIIRTSWDSMGIPFVGQAIESLMSIFIGRYHSILSFLLQFLPTAIHSVQDSL